MSAISRRAFVHAASAATVAGTAGAVLAITSEEPEPIVVLLRRRQAIMDHFNRPGIGDIADDDPSWREADELEEHIQELPILTATGAFLAVDAINRCECSDVTDDALWEALIDYLRRDAAEVVS
jgi:hypothetical protein